MVERLASSDGAASSPVDGVTWRELRRGLWVGRSNGDHLGVIEQGRRFTFTGADERSHRGFATLSAAQGAASGAIPIVPDAPRRGRPDPAWRIGDVLPRRSVVLLVLAAVVLVTTCGVLLLL